MKMKKKRLILFAKKYFKISLLNEKGIALLLVMGAIATLAALLVDFTYVAKVHKLQIQHQMVKPSQ